MDSIIAVNLKGVVLCMRHEVRHMVRQGKGVIVNMASLAGILQNRGAMPMLRASMA